MSHRVPVLKAKRPVTPAAAGHAHVSESFEVDRCSTAARGWCVLAKKKQRFGG